MISRARCSRRTSSTPQPPNSARPFACRPTFPRRTTTSGSRSDRKAVWTTRSRSSGARSKFDETSPTRARTSTWRFEPARRLGNEATMTNPMRLVLAMAVTASAALQAQPTAPVYAQYDGYVKQPDGGYVLSFGYYNQNNVDVTIDPGDANRFTPTPGDRNQPVQFAKGRHRFS